MGLQARNTSPANKATWLEFNAKAGALVIGFGDTREEFQSVTGEITDMFLMDPMKPKAGTAVRANAAEIPVKLVVTLKDGEDRYNVSFALHTHKDNGLTFTAMNVVGTLYGTLMHHFVEKEAGKPNAVRLAAGLTDSGKSWFASYGEDENAADAEHRFPKEKRIASAWGTKADGTLDLGVEKEINGRKVMDVPEGFVGTYPAGPQKGTQYIDTEKVLELVGQMLVPFEEARAQRAAQRAAADQRGADEAGIDQDVADEARDALRQRG